MSKLLGAQLRANRKLDSAGIAEGETFTVTDELVADYSPDLWIRLGICSVVDGKAEPTATETETPPAEPTATETAEKFLADHDLTVPEVAEALSVDRVTLPMAEKFVADLLADNGALD